MSDDNEEQVSDDDEEQVSDDDEEQLSDDDEQLFIFILHIIDDLSY